MNVADELAAMRMPPPKKERLSVTVPTDLAKWARSVATANRVPISAVVELALRRAMR